LISTEKTGEFMTADDAVDTAAQADPGPLPLTKADCREIFEMETMLTAWLRVYGKIRIDIRPGYAWPRYWIGDRQIDRLEESLRLVVLDVMCAHESFYSLEFLPAVARWREIAPGEPVPTDKEV
jgi:hypothetical protein